MLTYTDVNTLRAAPDAERFWHLAILIALRDKAERVEVRFTEDGAILYTRVDGRDWELSHVPDEIFPEIKPALRAAARLVSPERNDVTIMMGTPDAHYEPFEMGWLTYSLNDRLLDLAVRVDPREPWGMITLELEHPETSAGAAAEILSAYYEEDPSDNLVEA